MALLPRQIDRKQLQADLEARGVQSGVHYPLPCHLQPAFRDLGYRLGDFPHAEHHGQCLISLPMYPGMGEARATHVVEMLIEAMKEQTAATEPVTSSPQSHPYSSALGLSNLQNSPNISENSLATSLEQ